ncbi:hypothetical protein ACP70R_021788 [Stipagrostis hirtigluma subsp. patula]
MRTVTRWPLPLLRVLGDGRDSSLDVGWRCHAAPHVMPEV